MADLQKSYEIIGRVLEICIVNGLRGSTITPELVGISKDDREGFLHLLDVMKWLQNEGFISIGMTTLGGGHSGVQLRSKGIAAVEDGSFSSASGSIRAEIEAKPDGNLGADAYSKIGSFVGGFVGGISQSLG